jgi:UDP-N-acetylglucosamine 2-epimerase (non-hydrolysing)
VTSDPVRVVLVAGARPNFMKVAPIHAALDATPEFRPILVHTGQHYGAALSDVCFSERGMPRPDVNLGVGSGSHAVQTADVMIAFEEVIEEYRPHVVVVVGDVNSTLACALIAQRAGIAVAHVEAGLRSRDRSMPEETNRLVTDHVADMLLTPSPDADENLRAEGIPDDRIEFVGNVMIDSLVRHAVRARREDVLERLGLQTGNYALVTLHRPSNVDDPETFDGILGELLLLSERLPVLFPVHPRTRPAIERVADRIQAYPNFRIAGPQPYLAFLRLTMETHLVLTDSGGIQEETTFLGIPCLTLRTTTERPITMTEGTNRLVGVKPERIRAAIERVLEDPPVREHIPKFWDGEAATRIVAHLRRRFVEPASAGGV